LIELAELIQQLRQELDRARQASETEELKFELGPIDLETTVALERQGGAGGRIRFWVVDLEADARAASTKNQRIKLTLRPSLTTTTAHGTAFSSAYVSGPDMPGEDMPGQR
jgi:hypothetical protein